MQKVYGIIYKAETKNGSKIYIGQTINSLEVRRKQHVKLNKIMTKWEVIDKAYSREELDNKEKYWIDYYDSMNPKKGFNRQHGKGRWSDQARIDAKINFNSNKDWFKDLTSYFYDYFYSIDIDKINERLIEAGYEKLTKVQLCIFKFFIDIILNNKKADKKYRIGLKTILISFDELMKELPYLKNYPDIELQYDLLISEYDLFYINKEASIINYLINEDNWMHNSYAIILESEVIKKYKRIKEIESEYNNLDNNIIYE